MTARPLYAPEKSIVDGGVLSPREAIRASMRNDVFPERFRRNQGLIAPEDQIRLLDLPIFVAGCGGLGGEIAAALVRLGAGRLFLCDGDIFEESNLNRQRFCDWTTIGEYKAGVAARAFSRIAPWGEFIPLVCQLSADNSPPEFFASAIVIDCLDTARGKQILEDMTAKAGLAWLHGSVLRREGFACLRSRPDGTLFSLYGSGCEQTGAGPVLSHVVSGIASLMGSIFVKWLGDAGYSSPLLHADFSIPEVEAFQTPIAADPER